MPPKRRVIPVNFRQQLGRKPQERRPIRKPSDEIRKFGDDLRRELEKNKIELAKETSEWIALQLKEITARMHLTPQQTSQILMELVFIGKKLEQKGELSHTLPGAEYLRPLIEANPIEALRFVSKLVNTNIPLSQSLEALKEFKPLIDTRNPVQVKKVMLTVLAGLQKHKEKFFSPEFSPMRQMIAKKLALATNWNQISQIIENPMQRAA